MLPDKPSTDRTEYHPSPGFHLSRAIAAALGHAQETGTPLTMIFNGRRVPVEPTSTEDGVWDAWVAAPTHTGVDAGSEPSWTAEAGPDGVRRIGRDAAPEGADGG